MQSRCLILCLLSAGFCSGMVELDFDPSRTLYDPGQSIRVTCFTDQNNMSISWSKIASFEGDDLPLLPNVEFSNGPNYSTANFRNVTAENGGNYSCSDGASSAFFYINVLNNASLVPRVAVVKPNLLRYQCYQRLYYRFPVVWIWHKEGEDLDINSAATNPENSTFRISNNSDLVVNSTNGYPPKEANFSCALNTTNLPDGIWITWGYRLIEMRRLIRFDLPSVRMLGSERNGSPLPKTALTGESMTLICIFSGANLASPFASECDAGTVRWLFNNGTHTKVLYNRIANGSTGNCPCNDPSTWPENVRYRFSRSDEFESKSTSGLKPSDYDEISSVLEVQNFSLEDQGNYTCRVSNEFGQNETTVYVRVLDRFSAFWPFIGLLASAAVLCGLICYCQKRMDLREKRTVLTDSTLRVIRTQNEMSRPDMPGNSNLLVTNDFLDQRTI